jgi:hypothetical protein
MMLSALPVFNIPALKVNVESRMVCWHNETCQEFAKINNAMAGILLNILPLYNNIFQVVNHFFARW